MVKQFLLSAVTVKKNRVFWLISHCLPFPSLCQKNENFFLSFLLWKPGGAPGKTHKSIMAPLILWSFGVFNSHSCLHWVPPHTLVMVLRSIFANNCLFQQFVFLCILSVCLSPQFEGQWYAVTSILGWISEDLLLFSLLSFFLVYD